MMFNRYTATAPFMAVAALLLIAAPGCQSKDTGTPAAPAMPAVSTVAPAAATDPTAQGPQPTAAVDNTSVPDTTKIDGKQVPLKKTKSGLRYYDTKVGKGAVAKSGQSVTMKYTGMLLDGTIFDSTDNPGRQPFNFTLGAGQVIPGWDEGIVGMKVGGKRRLVIPGNLAYGPNPPTAAIPANATLVFDVELVGVK